jgi:hypothetical protein
MLITRTWAYQIYCSNGHIMSKLVKLFRAVVTYESLGQPQSNQPNERTNDGVVVIVWCLQSPVVSLFAFSETHSLIESYHVYVVCQGLVPSL